jgi:hypothetical protein
MAGRKPYSPAVLRDVEAVTGAQMHAAAAAGDWAASIAIAKHTLTHYKTTANRAIWCSWSARRGAMLGRVWRDFARGFRGLEWRRRKVEPGLWAVELLDASGAWIHAAAVESPPLRRMDDPPRVRVIAAPHPVTVHVLRAPDRCVGPPAPDAPQGPHKADVAE